MRVAGLQWQVTRNRELSRPCHRRIDLVVVSKRQAGSDRGISGDGSKALRTMCTYINTDASMYVYIRTFLSLYILLLYMYILYICTKM